MSTFGSSPEILDVTLRDGSYLIDFQFTKEDTILIASALDSLGLHWIEVGHGVGLNASNCGKGLAAATDEEYLEAAASSIRRAKWGMFFIPGIGREKDLRIAAKYGMSFVRIGTNITEIDQARPFIDLAKELGMIVSYNAMKSYAVSPTEFAGYAKLAQDWGVDIVCLVDSAGGMYPDDISQYFEATKLISNVPLGFHGHNNLSLAIANSLKALESGAVLVDASLQGMGRSGGNAITEVMVSIMKQRGWLKKIDLKKVMDVGQGLIQPLILQRGVDPMTVTAGYARFHSSFTSKVQSYAEKFGLDIRDLIVRLCQEDIVSAPDNLLEKLGQELEKTKNQHTLAMPIVGIKHLQQIHGQAALSSLVKEIRPQAIKSGKFSALNLVISEKELDQFSVSRNIQSTPTHIIGSVTLSNKQQLSEILAKIDGSVDLIFLDTDNKNTGAPESLAGLAKKKIQKSQFATYLDSQIWVEAVEQQIARLLDEELDQKTLVIAGDHTKSRLLALRLAERRAKVVILERSNRKGLKEEAESINSLSADPSHFSISYFVATSTEASEHLAKADLVVVWHKSKPWFGVKEIKLLNKNALVVDAGIGSITPKGLDLAWQRNLNLIRINVWPTLAGSLAAAHESLRIFQKSFGRSKLAGIRIVSGGAIGQKGDVVVDSVIKPTRIIGVADGRGGLVFNYTGKLAEKVKRVLKEIQKGLVSPDLSPKE